MANKLDSRQTKLVAVQPMIGNSASETLDTVFPKIDAELSKLFEDRNIQLSDGGVISYLGTTVQFTESLKLQINSKVAGGSPVVIDLASTTRTISANGRMIYAVINRTAGTAVVTDDAAALSAVTAANQEVVLIAKRIDTTSTVKRLYFRNGTILSEGQSSRLGGGGSVYASEFEIEDPTDTTKKVAFTASGNATASKTTLASTASANRTLTLPDATDTILARDTVDELTNKTVGKNSSAVLPNTLVFYEIGTPVSNPPAGQIAIYPKVDGLFYTLDSAGTEMPIGVASGGTETFLTSDTWTAPAGVTRVFVVGAGGAGGGGGGGDNISGATSNGGGGGQGVTTEGIWIDVIPGNMYTIIIGAGGTGGNGTNISANADGGAGGNGGESSFGVILFRNVGNGGTGGPRLGSTPGSGGGSGGNFNFKGGGGGNGGPSTTPGIVGNGSIFATQGAAPGTRTGNNGSGGGGGAGEINYVSPNGRGGDSNVSTTLTSLTRVSNVVTAVTSGAHNVVVGQRIHILSTSNAGFNTSSATTTGGGVIVKTILGANSFDYDQAGADDTASGGFFGRQNGFDGNTGMGGGVAGGAQNTGQEGAVVQSALLQITLTWS